MSIWFLHIILLIYKGKSAVFDEDPGSAVLDVQLGDKDGRSWHRDRLPYSMPITITKDASRLWRYYKNVKNENFSPACSK